MDKDDKITHRSLHFPSKYVKDLFEPRFSVKKDGKRTTKYFPENLDKSIELIVTDGLGYEPIRNKGRKNRIKNQDDFNNYLGNLEIRRIENSLEMWEYVTKRSLSMIIGSDYRMVLEKKIREINEIKDKLVKVIDLPRFNKRKKFFSKFASLW